MEITVTHGNWDVLTLKTRPEVIIRRLKEAIAKTVHLPAKDIYLGFNGTLLCDNDSLNEANLKNKSSIELLVPSHYQLTLQINVHFPQGETVSVPVTLTDTVKQLQDKLNVDFNSYLMLQGQRLNDDELLGNCGVMNDCSVILVRSFIVHFLTSDEVENLQVDSSSVISEFFKTSKTICAVPTHKADLYFSGCCIDQSKTFVEAGIEDGSSVFVKQRSWLDWLHQ